MPGHTRYDQVEGELRDVPVDIYLEGNIIFKQGGRTIYADRMYYSVHSQQGVVLDAEMLTPVEEYRGLLRLKADVLQQVNEQNFLAYQAALTSSRLGYPRYWFQSNQISVQDRQIPKRNEVGEVVIDPKTGEPAVDHELLADSINNFIYIGGVPVFYWPRIRTNLEKPTYYVDRIKFRNDNIFGNQVRIDWDAYQLTGVEPVPGTKWTISTDYLSERGFAAGTNYRYAGNTLFGLPGNYRGDLDVWGIDDSGLDVLGADRLALTPEKSFRGRIRYQHVHFLPNGYQFHAEVGLISDRNFLEQYHEGEWDQQYDQLTAVELKRYIDDRMWSLRGAVRLNDFFTETEWLPRLDHYTIGRSLLGNRLTWFEHSHVGYGRYKTASTPTDPADAAKFDPLPYEQNAEGIRAATRQEIDLPLDLGPMKVVPYVLGEAAYWGNDLNGESATRLLGQAGIRTRVPMWTVNPSVQSELWNLKGLAHKVTWKSEVLFAEADEDLRRFPLYDPIDDNNVEHFRRRLLFNTFGGAAGTDVPVEV